MGGISNCIVWNKFILLVKNSFSMLFSDDEFEFLVLIKGVVFLRFGISGVVNLVVCVMV